MPDGQNVADMVNHPPHYTNHPSRIECIQITEHMGFCLGNAFKYIWRADLKGGVEDLRKARWYVDREIAKRGGASPPMPLTATEAMLDAAMDVQPLTFKDWTKPVSELQRENMRRVIQAALDALKASG